jgi:peptide/nickel transport system substrate-binding protein
MKNRKLVASVAVLGLVASVAASTQAGAATKTTKKKAAKKPTKPAAATTAPATTAPAATTAPPAAAAKTGGKLIVGLEAETNGWIPGPGSWAVSGHTVSFAAYERLFALNAKTTVSPWLAESYTTSRDSKVFTIKLRKGIKFHNGEAFNAAAVKDNLDTAMCGGVLAPVFFRMNLLVSATPNCAPGPLAKLVKGVDIIDDSTVQITSPVPFPGLIPALAGQAGVMVAPAQLKANDRNHLIGTGPFKQKGDWKPNVSISFERNPDYWRKDSIAKLDEIEFRPIPDENTRILQIAKGELDMTHTANFSSKREFEALAKDGKAKIIVGEFMAETNQDVLNNSVPPFNTEECRLAAAYAMDVPTLIKAKAPGATQANGPFSKGTPGFLDETGYPSKPDLDKAKALYETCKAKVGNGKDVEFTMATTNDPEAGEIRDVMKVMVERAGFKIKTANIEQANYITAVLGGATQWATWRYYGTIVDTDTFRFNLHSETAFPNGVGSLNWQRAKDGQVDTALDQIRDSTDPVVRKRAAESISRQYGEKAYILWRWRTAWTVAWSPKVTFDPKSIKLANGDPAPEIPLGYVVDFTGITKS